MSLHYDLPIHKTGTELLGHVASIHAQLPRGYKKMIGDKIVDHCAEMLDLMALANATRHTQRAAHIRGLLAHQRAALVWLRVGFNLRKISTAAWSKAVQMLDSVGKQANGWLHKTQEKAPAA
ncbi:MAG TPA: four helix bundle protein [Polaromonas sp.]|uniref:four helix bundle protein n=1 Tax=Polaromonas sp. TaxID=1869339 RepID=UPI002D733433|nr:four helix bundle protein [Polaromonas sp.]HYW57715.1 four helix bundle protein [Polaromonas sp.]